MAGPQKCSAKGCLTQDSEVNSKSGGRTHAYAYWLMGMWSIPCLIVQLAVTLQTKCSYLLQQAFSVSHFLISSEPLRVVLLFQRAPLYYNSIAGERTPVFAALLPGGPCLAVIPTSSYAPPSKEKGQRPQAQASASAPAVSTRAEQVPWLNKDVGGGLFTDGHLESVRI